MTAATSTFIQRGFRRAIRTVRRAQPTSPSDNASVGELFTSRIDQVDIDKLFRSIDYPLTGPVVLLADHDYDIQPYPVEVIDCRQPISETFTQGISAVGLFVYACDSDALGLPYIKAVVQQHGKFLPVKVATPATYVHLNPLARNVLEAEWQRQNQQGFAKFDCGPGDFTNLIQAIDMTAAVAGSYIEVGCFRGSSSCVAMRYMAEKQLSRNCFFLDVFDGFDYPEAQQSADCMWQGTHQTEGRDVVAERIQQFQRPEQGLKANVLRRDIIGDPLPDDVDQIALANIDVDLYEAVAAALPKIAERMVHRGVMIVEDPGHTPMLIGSRLALDEFMATDLGSQFISLYMESGQTFLIRD
ncbi:MAG: hypothetical protein CBB71_16255 [Rhodopirellula sp. TMED11]|nr:MAG: hypothetical protein CBB71_16255 [Rhodopirellula sp. TMED11]